MLKYLLFIGVVMFSQIQGKEKIIHTEIYTDGKNNWGSTYSGTPRIKSITYFKDYVIEGVKMMVPERIESYTKMGVMKYECSYYGRKRHGKEIYYSKYGEKKREIIWKRGEEISDKKFKTESGM